MRGARAVLAGRWLVAALLLARPAWGGPVEIRVRSEGPPPLTRVVITGGGDALRVVDRTPGATVPDGQALGAGSAFRDEITLELPATPAPRAAAIDVSDDLVTEVRVDAAGAGSRVVVFVRQPVTYEVRRAPDRGGLEIVLRPLDPARTPVSVLDATQAARDDEGADGEVAVDAEELSYDQANDAVMARGAVTLRRGDMTLQADEVRFDRKNQIARAAGRVSLIDPEVAVRGSAAEVDIDRELGWVDDAHVELPENRYRLTAKRVEKCGPATYRAADGFFTTCRCGGLEKPSWSLGGEETEVTLGTFGQARGATFRVKDVPVLYFPRLAFPAATERQTGLLLPRLGYSNRRGFQYEQPFYWAIDKSSDATVVTDLETEARLGGAVEYRYERSARARGAFTAAYFNEFLRSPDEEDKTEAPGVGTDPDTPQNRFAFVGRHVQPFVYDSTFYLDLFAISDDLFLREVDFPGAVDAGSHARNTRFTRSRTGVVKAWDGGLLQLETAYFQDLIDPQELTLQQAPEIAAEHAVPLFGGRAVARVAGDTTVFAREQGFDGWRTQVAPEVFVPFQLGPFAFGSVRGVVREQLYYLMDREQVGIAVPDNERIQPRFRQARPDELAPLDRTHSEESAEVSARLGTQLARVYDFPHLGFARVRHTIEPEVRFVYVPPVSRELESVVLPACTGAPGEREGIDCNGRLFAEGYLFDQADAINRRSFLAYGVTSRLFGREADPAPAADGAKAPPAGPPRELARVSLLHGYDVSREVVNDSHASDVDLALRFTPVRYGGLGYSATVSFEEQKLIGQSIGLFLHEPWEPESGLESLQQPTALLASYRFVTENASRGLAPDSAEEALFRNDGVEELTAGVYLRLGDYLGFSYLSRYDFTDTLGAGRRIIGPHFLEQTFLLRVLSRCNCWVFDIGVSDRFDTDELSVRAQLTLVGLGGTGSTQGLERTMGRTAIPGLIAPTSMRGVNW
jgi:LPS-assembly protein